MDRLVQTVVDNWVVFSLIGSVFVALLLFNIFGHKKEQDQQEQ
jgi:hypothetical protein